MVTTEKRLSARRLQVRSQAWALSAWCLHVVPPSGRFSGFFPNSKHMHARWIGKSRLSIGVYGCLSFFLPLRWIGHLSRVSTCLRLMKCWDLHQQTAATLSAIGSWWRKGMNGCLHVTRSLPIGLFPGALHLITTAVTCADGWKHLASSWRSSLFLSPCCLSVPAVKTNSPPGTTSVPCALPWRCRGTSLHMYVKTERAQKERSLPDSLHDNIFTFRARKSQLLRSWMKFSWDRAWWLWLRCSCGAFVFGLGFFSTSNCNNRLYVNPTIEFFCCGFRTNS